MSDTFITVVSGLPRSGTSLMMQMLAAGGMPVLDDQMREPDDRNPRGYFECEAVKRLSTDSRWLSDAFGKAVKIVSPLVLSLPTAHCYRIVLMRRPIEEIVASQRTLLARQAKAGANLPDERIAELLAKQLAHTEHWLQEQPNITMITVDYHEIVMQPQTAAADVNDLLDGRLDESGMASVVDASLYREKSDTSSFPKK